MGFFVNGQLTCLSKSWLASRMVASVWLFPRVHIHVILQVLRKTELFLAERALVVLNHFMDILVSLQAILIWHDKPTSRVRAFSSLQFLLYGHKTSLVRVYIVAHYLVFLFLNSNYYLDFTPLNFNINRWNHIWFHYLTRFEYFVLSATFFIVIW